MDDLGEGDAGAQTFTVEARRVHAKLDGKMPPASGTRTANTCVRASRKRSTRQAGGRACIRPRCSSSFLPAFKRSSL